MKVRNKVFMVVMSTAVVLGVSACGQAPWEDSMKDLEGVTFHSPTQVKAWNNVDAHPNIVELCLDGVAFATTTREFENVFRVPEWDYLCDKPEGWTD